MPESVQCLLLVSRFEPVESMIFGDNSSKKRVPSIRAEQ